MPAHMLELIEEGLAEAGRELAGAKVALLGVAYLENADDTHNTPAADLAHLLLERGAEVIAHDPHVREPDWHCTMNSKFEIRNPQSAVPLTKDLDATLADADCAAIVTKHREYRDLQPEALNERMRTPVLVDGRNVFASADGAHAGLVMRAVGRRHE